VPGEHALDVPSPNAPEKAWVEAFSLHFERAIAKRLSVTTSRGVLFSGGLDSASVLGVSSSLLQSGEVDAFSLIDSSVPSCQETLAITRTLRACAARPHLTDCHSCERDAAEARALLVGMRRFMSGRFAFMALAFSRSGLTGVQTLFDGVDGDSLFSLGGGRDWIVSGRSRELQRNARKRRQLGGFTPAASFHLGYGLLSALAPSVLRTLARRRCAAQLQMEEIENSFLNRNAIDDFYIPDRCGQLESMLASHQKKAEARPQRSSMDNPIVLDAFRRVNERAREQGIQMMHPFADRALMDFCAWIPQHLRMKNGRTKWIMRKAMNRYLPHAVAWRADKHHIGANFDRVVLQPVLDRFELDLAAGNAKVQTYIDKERVLAMAARWRAGDIAAVCGLTELLLLEHWLQHNSDKVRWGC
jgi:asparagine synthase (glutamine-hydrolysing)